MRVLVTTHFFQPTEVRLRRLKARTTHPMFAAQLRNWNVARRLLQNTHDLRFAKSSVPHRLFSQLENSLTQNTGLFRGAGQTALILGAVIRRVLELSHQFRIGFNLERNRFSARYRMLWQRGDIKSGMNKNKMQLIQPQNFPRKQHHFTEKVKLSWSQ